MTSKTTVPDMCLIIICGVSGAGKSTIGRTLAVRLQAPFLEGDDFHSAENIAKMAAGEPLRDSDREDWLIKICESANAHLDERVVVACSALTPFTQKVLLENSCRPPFWIKLNLSLEAARTRMRNREHFAPESLADSQFVAWHPPQGGLDIDATRPLETIIEMVLDART